VEELLSSLHPRCSDGSFYSAVTRTDLLDIRIAAHNAGPLSGLHRNSRPLRWYSRPWRSKRIITDAIESERKLINGCSGGNKESFSYGADSKHSAAAFRHGDQPITRRGLRSTY